MRCPIVKGNMKYSEIISDGFYNIKLTQKDLSLIDLYFLGANHHRWRSQEKDISDADLIFHRKYYWIHMIYMMKIIRQGDFKYCKDISGRGFNDPNKWQIKKWLDKNYIENDVSYYDDILHDPDLFCEMYEDSRLLCGENHPNDKLFDTSVQFLQMPIAV